jgi:hypothetical protein
MARYSLRTRNSEAKRFSCIYLVFLCFVSVPLRGLHVYPEAMLCYTVYAVYVMLGSIGNTEGRKEWKLYVWAVRWLGGWEKLGVRFKTAKES